MYKYILPLIFLFLMAGCSSDLKKSGMVDYKSAYGFSSKISKNWVVVSRDEIAKKGLDLDSEKFSIFDDQFMKGVKLRIMSGRVEILLNLKKKSSFNDNINITLSYGNLLKKNQEKEFCEKMPAAFRKMLGKDITFFECGLKKVGEMDLLYLSYEGVLDNTMSCQYQFQVAPGRVVIATLTADEKSFDKLSLEFDNFIAGIRLDKK